MGFTSTILGMVLGAGIMYMVYNDKISPETKTAAKSFKESAIKLSKHFIRDVVKQIPKSK